jgi:putative Mg2+ transporter-C (MgtC) family protein
MDLTLFDFCIRIVCAAVFGFIIGLERQLTGHVAGIHTCVLVSIGACLFTLFSFMVTTNDMTRNDLTRVAAQVVTGVGFLCSGIILKEGLNIKGLNTATTIWCTAAIGVVCSTGYIVFAAIAAFSLFVCNLVFQFSDAIQPFVRHERGNTYVLTVSCNDTNEFDVRSGILGKLDNNRLHLTNLQSADAIDGSVEIKATVQISGRRKDEYVEKIVALIALEKGVTKAGWKLA